MPGDYHAHAVRWMVEQLGGSCKLLYPLDLCDGSEWSFRPDLDQLNIDYKGERQTLARNEYTAVWVRRPSNVFPQSQLTDTSERAVAEEEFADFAGAMMRRLEYGKFVVNPSVATAFASQKTSQLAVAEQIGLPCTSTLISNSPSEILRFFEICGNEIIFKPLRPALWSVSPILKTIVPTTLITDREVLLGADLSAAPAIFQKKIEKQAEIRATFMGRSVFAWEKRFENRDTELDIDWRAMHKDSVHKVHVLPDDLLDKCFKLLSHFGLVFGCFDFAIDADGTYHFLEVNPQGQFLWGDQLGLGINQLEAFAEFIMSGNPEFRYSNSNRFDMAQYDMLKKFVPDTKAEEEMHYGQLQTFHYKRVSVSI